MTDHCTEHGPLARTQPIDTELAALAVVTAVADTPQTEQIIAIMLDHHHIGHSILVVHETIHPDALLDVVDVLARSIPEGGSPTVSEVILASIRPGGVLDEGDADRWFEACEILEGHAVGLLEWFVVTDSVTCPRDLMGIAPRWSPSPTAQPRRSPHST